MLIYKAGYYFPMEKPPENTQQQWCRRRDRLAAQRFDVALVFLEMLGEEDAVNYLTLNNIPDNVILRIRDNAVCRRRDGDCWLHKSPTSEEN